MPGYNRAKQKWTPTEKINWFCLHLHELPAFKATGDNKYFGEFFFFYQLGVKRGNGVNSFYYCQVSQTQVPKFHKELFVSKVGIQKLYVGVQDITLVSQCLWFEQQLAVIYNLKVAYSTWKYREENCSMEVVLLNVKTKKQQKNKVGTMNLQDAKSSHFLKCNPTFIDCKINSCKAACFNKDFDLFVPSVKKNS